MRVLYLGRGPLEVKRRADLRGFGGAANNEACTVHTVNTASQLQCFVAGRLISCANDGFVYVQ
jgi:hypothetical protein